MTSSSSWNLILGSEIPFIKKITFCEMFCRNFTQPCINVTASFSCLAKYALPSFAITYFLLKFLCYNFETKFCLLKLLKLRTKNKISVNGKMVYWIRTCLQGGAFITLHFLYFQFSWLILWESRKTSSLQKLDTFLGYLEPKGSANLTIFKSWKALVAALDEP